jgi:hypothetical protein
VAAVVIGMMMTEAVVSPAVGALVIARAVNILT